jgi:ABC-type branched-subunit amino acid transport system substrate-binding protein
MKGYFLSTGILFVTILLIVSCYASPFNCNDPLGCQEVPNGDPVVIGALLTIYGDQGANGLKALDELRTTVEATGTFLDHPIDIDWQGTECTGDSARLAATLLALNQRIIAIIGPTCDSDSVIALPIFEVAGVLLIPPSPSPTTAFQDLLIAIQQVANLKKDGTLIIPRTTLRNFIKNQP